MTPETIDTIVKTQTSSGRRSMKVCAHGKNGRHQRQDGQPLKHSPGLQITLLSLQSQQELAAWQSKQDRR